MPLHDFECPACKQVYEQFVPMNQLDKIYACGAHNPPVELVKVFLKAPAGYVQPDICYDSPVDGRAITSKHARAEDLRRNNCVPYEPGMRQDMERRQQAEARQLDAGVDATVDEFFATAPSRKLEKLEQELHAGAAVEVSRASPATTT